MANPTADWEKVGDKFYRKTQLYTAVFDQDLELENYIVTGCSYGGAIGMSLLIRCDLLVFMLLLRSSYSPDEHRSVWQVLLGALHRNIEVISEDRRFTASKSMETVSGKSLRLKRAPEMLPEDILYWST
jgi:hypothetical protein